MNEKFKKGDLVKLIGDFPEKGLAAGTVLDVMGTVNDFGVNVSTAGGVEFVCHNGNLALIPPKSLTIKIAAAPLRDQLPDGSIESTLRERGARYGVFADHAEICQSIKEAMYLRPGWQRLAADQKQALEVIADKIARMLNGDPNYIDNWHDIIGYAKLVEDRLRAADTAKPDPAQQCIKY